MKRQMIIILAVMATIVAVQATAKDSPGPIIDLKTGAAIVTLEGEGELCGEWWLATQPPDGSTLKYVIEDQKWVEIPSFEELEPIFQGCLDGSLKEEIPFTDIDFSKIGKHSLYFAYDPKQDREIGHNLVYDSAWVKIKNDSRVKALAELTENGPIATYRLMFDCGEDIPLEGNPFLMGNEYEDSPNWLNYTVIEPGPGFCYIDFPWERGEFFQFAYGRKNNSGEFWTDFFSSKYVYPDKNADPSLRHGGIKLGKRLNICESGNNTDDSVITGKIDNGDSWRVYINYPKILPLVNSFRYFVLGQASQEQPGNWIEYPITDNSTNECTSFHIDVPKEDFPKDSIMEFTPCLERDNGNTPCLDVQKHPTKFQQGDHIGLPLN